MFVDGLPVAVDEVAERLAAGVGIGVADALDRRVAGRGKTALGSHVTRFHYPPPAPCVLASRAVYRLSWGRVKGFREQRVSYLPSRRPIREQPRAAVWRKETYMADVDQATQSMIRSLEQKTGKTFDAWLAIARARGEAKHKALVDYLKTAHDLTHGYANLVAHKALESDAGSASPDALVAAQYAGAKAALKPLYDRLVSELKTFGSDVELAPKKAYVSVRRSKQFALLQPSTATRLDVGLVLKGAPPTSRLETSGSFNAMVTHRVRVDAVDQVDKELVGWLKRAYLEG